MEIKMLKAKNGDCFIISHIDRKGNRHNIVIDGGPARAFQVNETVLKAANAERIDLMILTHTDDDHIGGLLKFFEKMEEEQINIGKVLYNSPAVLANRFLTDYTGEHDLLISQRSRDHSYRQAISLEERLRERNLLNTDIIACDMEPIRVGDIQIDILSPDEEQLKNLNQHWERESYSDRDHAGTTNDHCQSIQELQEKEEHIATSIANSSSIAFLLTYEGKKALFLGDANPKVITESLKRRGYDKNNKLHVEYTKLAHHGSRYNTSYEMLERLDCDKFLISTEGNRHGHPNKETLAKIIKLKEEGRCVNFYFNYPHAILTREEEDEYRVHCEQKVEFTME